LPTRSRTVPSSPEGPLAARAFLREVGAGLLPSDVLDESTLLTSELVTNATRHAGSDAGEAVEIVVSIDDVVLRVGVRDQGPGFDPEQPRGALSDGGWGLHLVRAISSRWGVERYGTGTEVWFEIDTESKQPNQPVSPSDPE
jgi:anti-sigma regulatory factor (Ser/Thr protein kinase)